MTCCKFCDQPAVENVIPPMCNKHLDLAVMAEFLSGQGRPVTVEAIRGLLPQCQANDGELSITAGDVETLMAGEFASKYQIVGSQ